MSRSKPYTLTMPLDAEKVAKLDQMLDVLYQDVQSVASGTSTATSSTTTSGQTPAQVLARVWLRN